MIHVNLFEWGKKTGTHIISIDVFKRSGRSSTGSSTRQKQTLPKTEFIEKFTAFFKVRLTDRYVKPNTVTIR